MCSLIPNLEMEKGKKMKAKMGESMNERRRQALALCQVRSFSTLLSPPLFPQFSNHPPTLSTVTPSLAILPYN